MSYELITLFIHYSKHFCFAGDKVIVLKKCNDGWWKGRKADSSEVGWFPSNYVSLEDIDLNDSALQRDSSDLSDDYIEMVVTLFPFISSNNWELTFEKDEVLKILDKPVQDPEWWKAKNENGQIGLVPRNYVQNPNTAGGYVHTSAQSQSSGSLSGQSREVISSRTPSWGIRSRFNLTGPFADRSWYYGNVTRAECDTMMNNYAEEGDFVLRISESNVSKTRSI